MNGSDGETCLLAVSVTLLLTFGRMHFVDGNSDSQTKDAGTGQTLPAGLAEDLATGQVITIDTPDGDQIAIYNVNGELFATENFCPHRGAPLSEGFLCGHVIECGLHGWEFDVRSGECLTLTETIKTFPVTVEDGVIKVRVS
jgi:nitrite reductase/ring-hydroxylating ferredoxin subunit